VRCPVCGGYAKEVGKDKYGITYRCISCGSKWTEVKKKLTDEKVERKAVFKIPLAEWEDFHSKVARMKPEEAIHYINAFIRKYPLYARCIKAPAECFVREENGVIVISII